MVSLSFSAAPNPSFRPPTPPRFAATWLPPRQVLAPDGLIREVICRTHHFRDPKVLNLLPALMAERFLPTNPDEPVEVAVYAGADGSDARSLAMLLAEQYGLDTARRFRFRSVDIDPAMVMKAQQRIVQLDLKERNIYRKYVKGEGLLLKPLAEGEQLSRREDVPHLVAEPLRQLLVPELGDLFRDARKPMQAKVVLFRNAWDHFSPTRREILAHNLFANMPEGALLVVGSESVDAGVRQLLRQTGFRPMAVEGHGAAIFEKPHTADTKNA